MLFTASLRAKKDGPFRKDWKQQKCPLIGVLLTYAISIKQVLCGRKE